MTWTTERWARIEQLFHGVLQAPAAAREEHLAAACGDDHELRAAVERLLAADAEDAWLEQGVSAAVRGHDPLVGSRVGAFTIVERLADGGMGTVYRASRTGADFAQEAAVKVLRLGLSTTAMRERFARERQTLARLVHPNVARLLDGGTTEAGVPYFAMELVDGEPLDRFCDARHLTLRARLQLFVVVCRAVQFAHQNLVVHLDLKPSNILVDGHGVPKLLDFGVAGLLSEMTEGQAAVAATRSRPLTPEYASPEQLRGEPVTTAADLYALGVVLYELLTGERPFARRGGDLELARAVCDTEPPRPSAAFARRPDEAAPTAGERAQCRGGRPVDVERSLRGDLDRIVGKAMARQAARRYASCQDLAADVERYLRGFPVLAREAGVAYRAAKFVRRHVGLVVTTLLLVASLVGGIIGTWRMAEVARAERDLAAAATRTAERERDAAAAARAEAERERDAAANARERSEHEAGHARIEALSNHLVAEFLGDMFLASPLLAERAQREQVLATIARRAEQVRRRHGSEAHLLANLLHALGRACTAIDAWPAAEALLLEAAALRERTFGAASVERALSLGSLGQLYHRQGRLAEAATALREAHRLHRECPPDVHTDVALAANDLAAVERALGNSGRARELHQEALSLRRQSGDPVLLAESLNNLANSEPDLQVARRQLEEALRLRGELLGPQDPLTIQSLANLGTLCLRLGALAEARQHLQAAVDGARSLQGAGTDGLAMALRSLAYTELRRGDAEAASAAIAEALALDTARFGADHLRRAACLEVRGAIEERQGRWPAARDTWQEVLRIRSAALPAGHRLTALARTSLGSAMVKMGDAEAAVELLVTALATLVQGGEATAADATDTRVALALAYEGAGDLAAAERELLAAVGAVPAAPEAARQAAVRRHLQAFYVRRGRPDEAARYAEPALPADKR